MNLAAILMVGLFVVMDSACSSEVNVPSYPKIDLGSPNEGASVQLKIGGLQLDAGHGFEAFVRLNYVGADSDERSRALSLISINYGGPGTSKNTSNNRPPSAHIRVIAIDISGKPPKTIYEKEIKEEDFSSGGSGYAMFTVDKANLPRGDFLIKAVVVDGDERLKGLDTALVVSKLPNYTW